MKSIPRERIIYNNYDLYEKYTDEYLINTAKECDWVDDEDEITNEMLDRWRWFEDETDWDCAKAELDDYFEGKTVGFFGNVGLWNGVYKAGKIGEFWELFNKAITDCGYLKIYDENGHLYLTCSHHDGTCHFEIKEITEKGEEYLENWEDNWNDKRKESYVHGQIFKRYSRLPRFAENVYGCKARDYEPQSKEGFIRILNNQARSNYC